MLNKIKQSMKRPHTSTVTPYMKFKREGIIGILFLRPQKFIYIADKSAVKYKLYNLPQYKVG